MASSNHPPAAPVSGPNRGVVAELTIAKSGQSAPLTAISTSSDQRHAVVGGHGIMKVCVSFACPRDTVRCDRDLTIYLLYLW